MVKQGKASSSKVGPKGADYEKQRSMTIEKNSLKFKELGLDKLADQLLAKSKNMQSKGKEKHKATKSNEADYFPEEDQYDDDDSEDEFFELSNNDRQETDGLMGSKSMPKKVLIV